jgi:hypothetical protein
MFFSLFACFFDKITTKTFISRLFTTKVQQRRLYTAIFHPFGRS